MTMNGTGCSKVSFDFAHDFLPPVYILVFIAGLLTNAFGLKYLLKYWEKVGPANVFVFNLVLADLLYLLTLPFLVVYHFTRSEWVFGDAFCKITRFCFSVNFYGSVGFLTCSSVYKYLSIVHPIKVLGRLTSTRSAVISLAVWVLVCAQSLPDMFFPKTYDAEAAKCFDTTSSAFVEDYLKYSVGWTITGFCLPFLVTVGCTAHAIATLCRSRDSPLKRRKCKLLLIRLLLLSVCCVPYHVLRNLSLWARVLTRRGQCYGWFNAVYVSKQVSLGLLSLNSALNPLLYLNLGEDLCSQLWTLLSRATLCLRRRSRNGPSAQGSEDDLY